MTEPTGSSQVNLRLTKAQESIARAKQRRALGEERPPWLLGLSLWSMFAAAVSTLVVDWRTSGDFLCTMTTRFSGANIPVATSVVLGTCAFSFVASILARERPLLLALILSVTASGLLTGIVLVAHDSAETTYVETCSLMGDTSTDFGTGHVGFVYAVWGPVVAVVLLQLGRALRIPRDATC